jgi:hypothetical protein
MRALLFVWSDLPHHAFAHVEARVLRQNAHAPRAFDE